MEAFRARTADGVWRQAYAAVIATVAHAKQPSRVGDTLEVLHVGLDVEDPRQRWVISRRPSMNPAFAIADALWILAGSNDASALNYWFRDLPKFAGHGTAYAGAYGHRLRKHFGVDQIRQACEALSSDPKSRQVVLQFWDARVDLPLGNGAPRSADVPCNVMSLLKVRNGRLEWTQIMRSNDLYRGLPNNFVQFTVLQEVMAGWLGLKVGSYHHWSDSLHIYSDSATELTCGDAVQEQRNNDTLAVSFAQGDTLVEEMYRRMANLTSAGLSEMQLDEIVSIPEIPVGYQNLLRVLGAESARRHGRIDQALSVIAGCTNPQLVQVWSAWLARVREVQAARSSGG